MSQALGYVLPLAIAVAVFPIPIIAVVVLVASDRGGAKDFAFVLAWCVGLTAVGAIVLALADGADASDDGEPATWVAVLLLALGLLLFAAAVKQWRGRPTAGQETPILRARAGEDPRQRPSLGAEGRSPLLGADRPESAMTPRASPTAAISTSKNERMEASTSSTTGSPAVTPAGIFTR